MLKVFLDANVFVDMWVADALLSIAERDILELAWSQRVLDEAKGLSGFGLVAESPDSLLTGLIDEQPEEVLRIMMDLASSKKRPPRTMREEISHLRRTGAPLFASRLEALVAAR